MFNVDLTPAQAATLLALLASARPQDADAAKTRVHLCRRLGTELGKGAEHYLTLPCAWENQAPDEHASGLTKLALEAKARQPQRRHQVDALLRRTADALAAIRDGR